MGLTNFYKAIREKLGNDLLLLPGICAIVFNDQGEILLQKRADTGKWAIIGGMLDPGEEPADAVIREVWEETAVEVIPQRITGVYTTPIITYANGDQAQFIITAFVCKAMPGEARVNDDESLEVGYFALTNLPELGEQHRLRIEHALANQAGAFFRVGNA
jgi:8-oxo-dGTP pyrophosphatase MutT (NUDIX family)